MTDAMKVHVLETGIMEADYTWLLLKAGYTIADRNHKDMPRIFGDVPTHAVLIEHPEGRILWDTGVPRDWGTRWAPSGRDQYWGVKNDPQASTGFLDSSLAQLELQPEDIDLLILSHMHIDHVGNARLFDNGHTRVLVNRKELDGVNAIQTEFQGGYLKSDFDGLPFEALDGDTEIFPGVTVLEVPGHTWGTMALQVDLPEDGTKIFTSDALYLRESYGPPAVGATIVWNNLLWLESVEKLRRIEQATGAEMFFGHDANQYPTMRFAPDGHYA